MQERASLAVLLETQMHLRYGYVKLDKNSLSLRTTAKLHFWEEESFAKKKKIFTKHLNYYPTNISHAMTGKSTYQFWGNWPSFSSLAPCNRRGKRHQTTNTDLWHVIKSWRLIYFYLILRRKNQNTQVSKVLKPKRKIGRDR